MKTIAHGDRKDATRVRDADTMHKFLPFLMPNRADNEAVMTELIDLAPIQAYIDQKNSENPAFKYTFFHVISAALAKTIALRPKLNRFYSGHRLYQRRDISLSFVVKKEFSDNGDEGLAIVCIDPAGDSPLSQLRTQVESIIHKVRDQKQTDGTTDAMGKLLQMPVSACIDERGSVLYQCFYLEFGQYSYARKLSPSCELGDQFDFCYYWRKKEIPCLLG